MLQEIKPKNARAARALAKRAPQLVENPKSVLFLRSTTTSSLVNSIVTDIYTLKRPLAKRFSRKNTIHPFEDPSSMEFFSQKNDTSLVCFSSHSKKRPHCITFIRCFDGKILDMLECLIDPNSARSLGQFGGPKCRIGTKPLLSFQGSLFDDADPSSKFMIAKSLFLDFFKGEDTDKIAAEGLQMLLTFTAAQEGEVALKQDVIYMRTWRLVTKRGGHGLPRVELEEIGPRINFKLGRVREADSSALRVALKRGKGVEARPKKNVATEPMGDKIGRIHIGKQDLQELQTRKMKGLKRSLADTDNSKMDEEHNENLASGSDGELEESSLREDAASELDRSSPISSASELRDQEGSNKKVRFT